MLLYNAISNLLAVTIVEDLFAIAFCAVGATMAALTGFNGGDEDPRDPDPHNEIIRFNPGAIMAMKLSLVLV